MSGSALAKLNNNPPSSPSMGIPRQGAYFATKLHLLASMSQLQENTAAKGMPKATSTVSKVEVQHLAALFL